MDPQKNHFSQNVADDCIGTLAHLYAPTHEIIIFTVDRDLLQLVDDGIRVAILKKGIMKYLITIIFMEKKESFQNK
ncbi:hypothetical protein [Aeribacillus sp. FSL M8-0254]|uniref:hypothetical protein n=1 Tax=Aeribacillus sp. FSL M8-0254 TaxID=2954577 RepID=UPI0030F9C47F